MNPFVNKDLVTCALETKHWPNVLNYKTRLIKEPSEIKLIQTELDTKVPMINNFKRFSHLLKLFKNAR